MRAVRVLVVCTANVYRSRVTEELLRLRLAGAPVDIGSAGTRAASGEPVPPCVRTRLRDLGCVVAGMRPPRRLTADLVQTSDVVITLTAAQRSEVLRLVPRALARTVTLGELARWSMTPPPLPVAFADRLLALVHTATDLRGGAVHDDDVPDPRLMPERRRTDVVAMIAERVDDIASTLLDRAPLAGGVR
ncbi:hypothetical protein [Actinosynnema sp. NPDC020468]|uniref:arsenate-mycothiol transferase ArsC n=1 Tax=Actinosynnema sp. NPDC020468 TaxID=3154488 RepID=UPI0033E420BC